jgi:hypothetical protein
MTITQTTSERHPQTARTKHVQRPWHSPHQQDINKQLEQNMFRGLSGCHVYKHNGLSLFLEIHNWILEDAHKRCMMLTEQITIVLLRLHHTVLMISRIKLYTYLQQLQL